MPEKDPRVDAYIEKSAPFAKPILVKLRKLIFQACPEVEETIKWSFPNYEVHGRCFAAWPPSRNIVHLDSGKPPC